MGVCAGGVGGPYVVLEAALLHDCLADYDVVVKRALLTCSFIVFLDGVAFFHTHRHISFLPLTSIYANDLYSGDERLRRHL